MASFSDLPEDIYPNIYSNLDLKSKSRFSTITKTNYAYWIDFLRRNVKYQELTLKFRNKEDFQTHPLVRKLFLYTMNNLVDEVIEDDINDIQEYTFNFKGSLYYNGEEYYINGNFIAECLYYEQLFQTNSTIYIYGSFKDNNPHGQFILERKINKIIYSYECLLLNANGFARLLIDNSNIIIDNVVDNTINNYSYTSNIVVKDILNEYPELENINNVGDVYFFIFNMISGNYNKYYENSEISKIAEDLYTYIPNKSSPNAKEISFDIKETRTKIYRQYSDYIDMLLRRKKLIFVSY